MSSTWKLWFHFALPDSSNAFTHYHESPHLPYAHMYAKELKTDPHKAKFRLETLSPAFKSDLMEYTEMMDYFQEHREEQMRYTVRVYSLGVEDKGGAGDNKSGPKSKDGKTKTKSKTFSDGGGVSKVEKGKQDKNTSVPKHDVKSGKVDKQILTAKDKGKVKELANKDGEVKTEITGASTDDAKTSAGVQLLRMKGRQELASASIKAPTHPAWSDSDGESGSDECFWPSGSPSELEPKASKAASGSKAPVVPASEAATSLPSPTIPECATPASPTAVQKPLFDQAQLADLERIIAEATTSVPAGKEEDDLHQRLLSMLESIKPAPAAKADIDGRICAKPPQPVQPPAPIAVFRCDVGLDTDAVVPDAVQQEEPDPETSVAGTAAPPAEEQAAPSRPSDQPLVKQEPFDETLPVTPAAAPEPASEPAPVYGITPAELLISGCPSPVLAICPPKPQISTANATPSIPINPDGILSPDSQKTLQGLYIAELLSSPLNTPASRRVYDLLVKEDVGLDSSLGLELLDLAKSLRADGGLGRVPERDEAVQDEVQKKEKVKVDRMEGMLRKVLEKLNDHSGMLNAIAEASGVDLLDDDEDAETPVIAPAVIVPAAMAAPPVAPTDEPSTSIGEALAPAASTPPDIMATLAEVTASLVLLTPSLPSVPLTDSVLPAAPTPAATRLPEVAASLGTAPALFSPSHPSAQARPLPSVEDYASESESDAPTPSNAGAARGQSRSRSPSPRRPGPPRNPFADPPQFGRSYTPARPVPGNPTPSTAPRERPAGAFARYAANTPAFPTAAAAARSAQASSWATALTESHGQAGRREAFYHNVDSYASPPASMFHPPHHFQHMQAASRSHRNESAEPARPAFPVYTHGPYYHGHPGATPHHYPFHAPPQPGPAGPWSHFRPPVGGPFGSGRTSSDFMWGLRPEDRTGQPMSRSDSEDGSRGSQVPSGWW